MCRGRIGRSRCIDDAHDARQNRLRERRDENPDTKNRRNASNH
jgi:hypothetical protein